MRITKQAVQARCTYRQAKALALKLEQKQEEGQMTTDTLSRKDNELVARYYDDSLRKEANVFTLESRNGRLYGPHGEVLDIGGSTGGYVRGVLQQWEEPDTQAFEEHCSKCGDIIRGQMIHMNGEVFHHGCRPNSKTKSNDWRGSGGWRWSGGWRVSTGSDEWGSGEWRSVTSGAWNSSDSWRNARRQQKSK